MKVVQMMNIYCEECNTEHSIPLDYEEEVYCECGELLAGFSDEDE